MFRSDAELARGDWPLLQNGAVNLFWKLEVLANARQTLTDLDYEVAEVSCGSEAPSFEVQVSHVLRWEDQFGYEPWNGNLDAFNDGMRYFPFGTSGRSALVLTGFHRLVAVDSKRAHSVLDIIESSARDHLLRGKVLIALVQTDDPRYSCDGIGCRSANWNRTERLHASRGL